MNDIMDALAATVRVACVRHSDHAYAEGGWNSALWDALEQIGVTVVSVPEQYAGAGGDVATSVALLEIIGRYSAAVPFAETDLLAGWLLAGSDTPVSAGPLTAAVSGPGLLLRRAAGQWSVTGTIARVPWARWARHVAVLADDRVVLLHREDFQVREGVNLAGEPRDDVVVNTAVPASQVSGLRTGSDVSADGFRRRAALARAALMAGAAGQALELSVSYARKREQFGRPIAKFQAVQQHLAAMAAEVLLSKTAVEAAALAVDAGDGAEVAVAAAKVVAGQAAGTVTSLAHQVHGAIGYTEEHALRLSTMRLWAWRDEAGNEDEWSAAFGRLVLEGNMSGLWPLVTGTR